MRRLQRTIGLVPLLMVAFAPAAPGQTPRDPGSRDYAERVIASIRENEELYKNIDLRWKSVYTLETPKDARSSYLFASEVKTIRSLTRDEKFLVEVQGTRIMADGRTFDASYECTFDGRDYRYRDAQVGNLNHDRVSNDAISRSPCFLGFSHLQEYSVSNYLATGGSRKEFNGEPSKVVNGASDGPIIDGLKTVRLVHHVEMFNKGEVMYIGDDVLWLVPERNWLPVRSEVYFYYPKKEYGSLRVPAVVSHAEGWRELQPGVWIATQGTEDFWDVKSDSHVIKTYHKTYEVTFAELDGGGDDTVFRSITFPKGLLVHEIRGGKPVRSYVVGSVGDVSPGSRGWWMAIAALIALAVLVAIVLTYRRRYRGAGRGAPKGFHPA
jgi:hypothetical protein